MRISCPVILAVFVAWVVPAAAQTPAPLPPPPEPYVTFLVDEATGAATPLETAFTKPERAGSRYLTYLPGATSPVVLPAGAPLRFVIKVGGLKDRPKIEDWRVLNKLERLAVGKDRRYATKEFVPMDVAPYGEVTTTLDKKNKTLYWMTLVYTPRQPLPPGEYAFSASGLIEPAGFSSRVGRAFRTYDAR